MLKTQTKSSALKEDCREEYCGKNNPSWVELREWKQPGRPLITVGTDMAQRTWNNALQHTNLLEELIQISSCETT